MKTAIYAFSGDPITYGHINIVNRAKEVFDKVIVAIGENPNKKYTFSLREREAMAKKCFSDPSIEVLSFSNLLIDFAYEQGASVIIKGVRNADDFNYEKVLHSVGQSQQLGIDTHILFADPELAHVSSSAVKAIVEHNGDIHKYVPLNVKQKLEETICDQYIIGITGVPGSGKSYIGELLTRYPLYSHTGVIKPIHNIELDHIGHQILGELMEPSYVKLRKDIGKIFGKKVLKDDGFIDRKALGDIVFNDHQLLRNLNKIMAKPILVRLRKELSDKKGIIFVNCALLAEAHMLHICNNNVILVQVEKETQECRLEDRGYTDHQRNKRVFSQYDEEEKRKDINTTIDNDHHGRLWVIDNSDDISDGNLYSKFAEIVRSFNVR